MANTKITSRVLADNAVLTANITDANVTTAKVADNAVTGDKVSDDVALAGNPTTTTQSAGNNTTRIATTAFVSTAVSNLVDSSPSALNTLNELAAALGDDANFSTTVTNSIAAKLPLAGGALTGNIGVKVPSLLSFRANSNEGAIQVGKRGVLFADSGVTTDIANNTYVTSSNQRAAIEADIASYYQQYQGVHKWLNAPSVSANATQTFVERMVILADGKVGIGTTSPAEELHVSSAVSGQHTRVHITKTANAGTAGLSMQSKDASAAWTIYQNDNSAGDLNFHDGGAAHVVMQSNGNVLIDGVSNYMGLEIKGSGGSRPMIQWSNANNGDLCAIYGTEGNDMVLTSGSSNTERMRIASNGQVKMCGAAGSHLSPQFTSSILFTSGGTSGEPHVENKVSHTNTFGLYKFQNGNGTAGSISMYASEVSYNTTSDYRLKENVNYTWDATTKLKELKPCEFEFKADTDNVVHQGFLAHEVDNIVPNSVFGEKDGEEMQQLDHSKLVPLLVKTIQELEARIKTLEDA